LAGELPVFAGKKDFHLRSFRKVSDFAPGNLKLKVKRSKVKDRESVRPGSDVEPRPQAVIRNHDSLNRRG